METDMTDNDANRYSEFLQLFLPVQLSLRRFIAAHVMGYHKAEDACQEVALVLWKHFETYDRARPFQQWAIGVAWNVVLKARRSAARDRHVFREEVGEQITDELVKRTPELDSRQSHLDDCLRRLSSESRTILDMKYTDRRSIEEIAAAIGRTPNAVSMVFCRVRVALRKCVQNMASGGERSGEATI
jgi:RNA polymerase sigma-70 factor, ECF subfamily